MFHLFNRNRQKESKSYRTIFFCASEVDEVWIRSTIRKFYLLDKNIVLLIVGPISEHIRQLYATLSIEIHSITQADQLKHYHAPILVTASTSIKKEHFSHSIEQWVHMPHSLVSLHGVYPEDAFDAFNVLFASTPYHAREFSAIAQHRRLENVTIKNTGYGKLDLLLERNDTVSHDKNILIAPSWGKNNILETTGMELIKKLLEQEYVVTLRPHCMFFDSLKKTLDPFYTIDHPNFTIEDFSTNNAIHESHVLITDFSGIAFEYYYTHQKKIIFVETTPKIFNKEFPSYNLPLFEIDSRSQFGHIIENSAEKIIECIKHSPIVRNATSETLIFSPSHCGMVASHQLMELMDS